MKDEAYLQIGNVRYNLNAEKGEEISVTAEINKPKIFEAKLNQELLIPFNYNNDIKIFVKKDDKDHILFNGKILTSERENHKIILKGADPLEALKHRLLSADFRNFRPQDIFYHLAKMVELNPVVQGTFFDGKLLKFKIIIPINNLSLQETELDLCGINFVGELESSIKENINTSSFKEKFMDKSVSFAIVDVESVDFIQAYKIAISKVTQALDWLSFVKNFSLSTFDKQIFEWDTKRYDSLPVPSTLFYGQIEGVSYILIIDYYMKKSSDLLEINSENNDFVEFKRDKFRKAFERDNLNIRMALHWLRRAREQGTLKDKLLDYFTCIEFIINKQKVEKLFSKSTRTKVTEGCKNFLSKEQIDRLNDYLSGINAPSFKMRLFSYIEEKQVNLNEDEKTALEKTRVKRCLLEHGNADVGITEEELKTLSNIVERLIIYKIEEL